ncbi:MAG TPA: hypothetical protein VGD17_10875 [Chitinophagaceae bacterium]
MKTTNGSGRMYGVILMMASLLWLSVSAPFVYAAQQAGITHECQDNAGKAGKCEKTSLNPFTNTTEEKPESGSSTLSEYLHDLFLNMDFVTVPRSYFKCHSQDEFYSFHPELITPPPKA